MVSRGSGGVSRVHKGVNVYGNGQNKPDTGNSTQKKKKKKKKRKKKK